MNSDEAIKSAKEYDEFLKKGTQAPKPTPTIKILKDNKTISGKEQSVKIRKYSKYINE